MGISFHPEATMELEASADWYAERSPTAARNFCVAVDIALANIESDPERFVQIDDRHRACSVQKFPFQMSSAIVKIESMSSPLCTQRGGQDTGVIASRTTRQGRRAESPSA